VGLEVTDIDDNKMAYLKRLFNPPDLQERLAAHEVRVREAIERDRAGLPMLDYGNAGLNYVVKRHVERDRAERGQT
jgi:hypothetical protein